MPGKTWEGIHERYEARQDEAEADDPAQGGVAADASPVEKEGDCEGLAQGECCE